MTELLWSALLDGLYVLQIHWMLQRIGNFGFLPALLFQVPLVFFVFVFGLSLFRIFFMKKVPWKGRTVNTKKEKS
jgi:4,4'-diaponeurosporenoate glycosyltransferase